jgi:hypothetical protein
MDFVSTFLARVDRHTALGAGAHWAAAESGVCWSLVPGPRARIPADLVARSSVLRRPRQIHSSRKTQNERTASIVVGKGSCSSAVRHGPTPSKAW